MGEDHGMEKKIAKKESEEKPIDKSQEPLDYRYIEELRQKAWADPEVKRNWAEFNKKQKENNK